jgi:hypothetical protein
MVHISRVPEQIVTCLSPFVRWAREDCTGVNARRRIGQGVHVLARGSLTSY